MNSIEIPRFPLDIRFSDLDAMGHVNNAVFFTYFEEARKHVFFTRLRTPERPTFNFILARSACDYKVPLLLEDKAEIEIWVGEIGVKSFTIRYRILDGSNPEKIYATGESVLVSYDYAAEKSVPIDNDMRSRLEGMKIA